MPRFLHVALALLAPLSAQAGTLTTLYTFTGGADGGSPFSGVVPGPKGSLLGTTLAGGAPTSGTASGTVYQLTPPAAGKTAWTLSTVHAFGGAGDGATPYFLLQSGGVYYGVAQNGGLYDGNCELTGSDQGCGTIFKLIPPAAGSSTWTFSVIYSFPGGAPGGTPFPGLSVDKSGNLYGFSSGGICTSTACNGVAFKLAPPAKGQTAWTESVIYSFAGGADGVLGYGSPVITKSGVLYGVTQYGGATKPSQCQVFQPGCGTAFALVPPATAGAPWKHKVIWTFNGEDGTTPTGLVADAAGNLYGDTNVGGSYKTDCLNEFSNNAAVGCGTVFELTPPTVAGKPWTETTLYRFPDGAPGAEPLAAPIFNAAGDLLLNTSGNEPTTDGSLVELLPPAKGKTVWAEKTLHAFTNGTDSGGPTSIPYLLGGVVYGTTSGLGSGPAPSGTVLSVVP
jgi:hypothetical protein